MVVLITILDEIIRRLLQECSEVEDTAGDGVIGEFLEKYGNSSKVCVCVLVMEGIKSKREKRD